MKITIASALVLAGATSAAADITKPNINEATVAVPGASESDCGKAECRAGGNQILLHYDATHGTQFTVPHSPYQTDDGSIVIYPGETLLFDFPEATSRSPGRPRFLRTQDGKVKSIDPAAANARPQLTLFYRQEQASPDQFQMQINVNHSLPAPLKFDTSVSHFTSVNDIALAKSASCVVIPNRMGIQIWPEMVGPVVLSDLRFSDAPSGNGVITCE